ncbi:MAG: threonylcarbamoyl-AMP synthase [Candidatus Raymondbacteria bacterium RifOxyA12_full_50_37]|uniref:L-threonylcarbamoyladenylate synthase n=1 Tax=Candidatus Raymondbacteria bacterium RIFOXYD12_FULL_49_13 TaxID=1817890 RepID=A0A1F7EZL5_UNCRA|nr:MAG: threonylcarbamoyl-AMP synthase [Candidatus Raymondbacteria bacterium RifOxyA12_full_50_37]OGJ92679.1 MAG: threonylcarbamoyl-AMP synthase [Candidatus Raymondbacteria bacterium RIFOXYA2_FULL_49_16]OGJ93081.1 MAG: threonylcarbamoyl-AMP synthase [Candidatus Raymondbacteria bacterium RifOxyC12_full_50_8]OGJ99024.1 MAG: threonylcarbamoyl-AMP synthase [Candidatus Raymondbacteria bacterium RIFOXYC2_FULL_50_21]OGJ99392.1 MAG: threonylcarbamoyl-AMP synthase [Candidatus Raymondbacteria bacterium R
MISKIKVANRAETIQRAAELLKKGGVIVHPTETLYGFATNALIINAIKRVDRIKERGLRESYIILVRDIDMARSLQISFDETAVKLADRHWPGPLTLVLPVSRESSLLHLAFNGAIGMRVSPDEFVRKLFTHIDFPIISTSVNISGKPPMNDITKIEAQFYNDIDLFCGRGTLPHRPPSTIATVVNNTIKILRKGAVSEEQVYAV